VVEIKKEKRGEKMERYLEIKTNFVISVALVVLKRDIPPHVAREYIDETFGYLSPDEIPQTPEEVERDLLEYTRVRFLP